MSLMMRNFGKDLLGTLACSLWLVACSGDVGDTAALNVDRSNTLDLSRGSRHSSLEGRWNAVWPKIQITRDAAGLYTGRLLEPNARCGYERGEEVLRGSVDADSIFSGEVLVCTAGQCPGVAAKWIYFMALVDEEANHFVGALAPTTHEGCNTLFRGQPLSGIRDRSAASSAGFSDAPREARLTREQNDATFPAATGEPACQPIAPRGYLQMAEASLEDIEISVDGSDWGKPPFLRPIVAGNHRLVLKRKGAPPIARTFCVPGGKEPFLIEMGDFLEGAAAPGAMAGPRPPGSGKAAVATEGRPCKRSAKKGVLKITLPALSKASLAIDGKVQNTRGRKAITRELPAGEHTVMLLRADGAPDVERTVCVQEGRTPTHVNFEAP